MAKTNICIHDGGAKVRWLFALASRDKAVIRPKGGESIRLPDDFPRHANWKDFAAALGTTSPNLNNWFPDPVKPRAEAPPVINPPTVVVRNIARIFGFAPRGGSDDDDIWRDWWLQRWPSFIAIETSVARDLTEAATNDKENITTSAAISGKKVARKDAAAEFADRYLEALAAGELQFQEPVFASSAKAARRDAAGAGPKPPAGPARPALPQAQELAALIDRFGAELAREPRFGNVREIILGLPDPSRWEELHFDWLLNVQEELTGTFHRGEGDGEDVLTFGALAPLLSLLAKVLALSGVERSDAYCVIVDNQLAPILAALRYAIRGLPADGVPLPAREDVTVLDDYLGIVERRADRRIDLKRVDGMAHRIRRHRIGALTDIERLVAVLIGKRADRAPPRAIFRDELPDGSAGPEMIVIPAGTFLMGSPQGEEGGNDSERPQHRVTFARPFAIGRFAVTFEEWDAARVGGGATHDPNDARWGRGRQPVINVSWNDATEYAAWLSRETGQAYRLPTEAEWEYACRAGTTSPFWWGSSISTGQANYDGTFTYGGGPKGENRGRSVPIDWFAPNSWGLYQVHGNVWEWCADNWHGDYTGDPPVNGSAWEGEDEGDHVLRGGAWDSPQDVLRSAVRFGLPPVLRSGSVGFRVARTLSPPTSQPLCVL